MGKVSFEEIEATPVETAIVARPETAIALPLISDPSKGLIGEWTAADIRLPRLNLVNKSGDLSNNFTPGTWVLQKEHQISNVLKDNKEKGESIKVIGVRMSKQYQENIPYDERESTPTRVFDSATEVRGVNGLVNYKKGVGYFSEIAHIEFFVQEPEGLSEDAEALFFYTFGDHKYARVIYTASSTAFSAIAITMASATARGGHLATVGLIGGFWDLGSVLTKNLKNSWWSPTLRSAGLVEDSAREEIAALI